MALIIIRPEPQEAPEKQGFDWDTWYAQNRQRLSEKRAKRYKEDAVYREAALKRGREQRKKPKVAIQDEFSISFNEMAKLLGVTVWVLREWRRKDYFPEPKLRDGRLWFKPEQSALLLRLLLFFDKNGVRMTEEKKGALQDVIAVVYSNW